MDLVELSVDDVAAGGDGIARAEDGRVVFVRGAIPGDRVRAEVTRDKPRRLHAVTRTVLEPSPDRVEPPCPHVASGCGGCGWQHVAPEAQRRAKVRLVEESLRRIGHLEAEGTVALGPALPEAAFRTTLRAAITADGLALRHARSHDTVPIDSCLVLHPGLESLVADVDAWGAAARSSASRDGAVEATLRIGGATGERLVWCAPTVPAGLALPDDVTVVGKDELRAGARARFHDEVAGVRFRISARSFFQTRTDGAAALVEAVRVAGGERVGAGPLVDLYGGVGLFGGVLGQGCEVTLVESSASSVADARANLPEAATVIRSDVGTWRPPPGSDPALVVADPPRAGLGRDGVATVVATGADRLVLVSCDAAAFGRDAGLLAEAGFTRTSTTLVDLFPHTPHVELVSGFDRTAS